MINFFTDILYKYLIVPTKMKLIPMRNMKKEITGYTKVSDIDFEELNKYKWHIDDNGYAGSKINKKPWVMHRFITICILNNDITPDDPVDHINHEKLDNTRENLFISTPSDNARNKVKQEGTSSIYVGVSRMKDGTFLTAIRINGKRVTALYKNELHGAHQYNLWLDEYNLKSTRNEIDIPSDFIKWVSSVKLRDLPTGITKSSNGERFKARISIKGKTLNIGTYDTLQEAISALDSAKLKKEKDKNDAIMAISKNINELGFCYFMIKDKQILVDSESFHDIMKYPWTISKKGYITGTISDRNVRLSHFVMNRSCELHVDHINNNPLDNRKCNLRLVTPKQNAMNMSSRTGSSSQYIGVHFRKDNNKWRARIQVNEEDKNLGQFDNEIDAAKARDIATKKYFKEYGKLNFPDE
jgi:hypothetical protein